VSGGLTLQQEVAYGCTTEVQRSPGEKTAPSISPNRAERARAWAEWQMSVGQVSLLKFIRVHNTTSEPDEDILQEAMFTAYLESSGAGTSRVMACPSQPTSKGSHATSCVKPGGACGSGSPWKTGKPSRWSPAG